MTPLNEASDAGALEPAPTIAALDPAPRAAFELLRRLGARGATISAAARGTRPRDLDRSGRRDLLATARRTEVVIAAIDLLLPAEHFADPAHVDRAVTAVVDAIEFCADLGRPPLSVPLPNDDASRPAVDAAASAAERHGVLLANSHIASDDPGETGTGTGASAADRPTPAATDGVHAWIGVCLDPPAWLGLGRDPVAEAVSLGDRLVVARLADLLRTGMRGPIGEGADARLDPLGYRAALDVAGFAGPLVLDARGWLDPIGGVTRSLERWRALAPGGR